MAFLVHFQMAVQTGYTAMHMAVGDLFHHNVPPWDAVMKKRKNWLNEQA